MTSSYSHTPNSHLSRRASVAATSPYTIPQRQSNSHHNAQLSGSYSSSANGTPFSPPPASSIQQASQPQTPQHSQHHQSHSHNHQHHSHHKNKESTQQLSSSVPVLSREFVARRISEGESGRLKEELKCEACGKGYKHVSSLAKHLWEHTPEWNVTKKLLISKHQQVQLLEAASILVSMNDIPSSPKNSVAVPPTIDEESTREDSVQFNPKYTEKSYPSSSVPRHTSPLNDTAPPSSSSQIQNPPDHVASSLKMRMNSISQIPPSSMNDALFGSSPARFEPGSLQNNGGFLDVPKRGPVDDKSSPKEPEDDDDDGVFGAMD